MKMEPELPEEVRHAIDYVVMLLFDEVIGEDQATNENWSKVWNVIADMHREGKITIRMGEE